MVPDIAQAQRKRGQGTDVPGFFVNYTADNPRDAQAVCSELTSMMLEENLKAREQVAQGTTDFLARQVEEAKHNLDDLDSKLAVFKKQYMGQLPGDEDQNLKLLMGLNSQLDANTQTVEPRAAGQGLYRIAAGAAGGGVEVEPVLDQSTNLEQQLTALQSRS